MSKNNENKLVPKLRFPEFMNDGEWIEKLIEQYFNVGSSKRVLQEDWTINGVPFFRTRELVSLSKNEPFRSEVFISEDLFSELKERYGVPTEGDFLVSGVGTLGVCYQVQANDKFYFKDGNVLWFKLENGLNSTYFKYCFQSDHIQNQIIGQTSKSTVGTYTIQNAKKTKFWFPSTYQEQQKIASCLSSLDEVITAESKKLEVLKEHKKGLLQNLFPQEGETVPKLRFKEFEDSGEWRSEGVGNLFKFKQGVQVPVEKQFPVKTNDRIRFIRIIDITSSSEPFRYIDNPGNEHVIGTNDLFMIRYGTPGLISIGYEGVIANNLFRIIWKYNDLYVPKFWFYTFQKIEKLIYGLSSSSSMPAISFSTMDGILLVFPKNPKEQQKIASALSSLDELITAQTQKIEALQLHKKGLLQGLFPNLNEITE